MQDIIERMAIAHIAERVGLSVDDEWVTQHYKKFKEIIDKDMQAALTASGLLEENATLKAQVKELLEGLEDISTKLIKIGGGLVLNKNYPSSFIEDHPLINTSKIAQKYRRYIQAQLNRMESTNKATAIALRNIADEAKQLLTKTEGKYE